MIKAKETENFTKYDSHYVEFLIKKYLAIKS